MRKVPLRSLIRVLATAGAVAASLGLLHNAYAGTFTTDFTVGVPPNTSVNGDAAPDSTGGVGGGPVLKLTINEGGKQGSWIIEDLDNGAAVSAFTATFSLLINQGSGTPADGFSFNFASDLPDSSFGEEGTGTGLTVSFDTYDNGGGEAPAIDVKWAGALVATTKVKYADLATGDTFAKVSIKLANDGTVNVDYKGQTIYSDLLLPGFAAISGGRFGFGARTGGEYENHWLDDVSITTVPGAATTPNHPLVTSASPRGGGQNPDVKLLYTIKEFTTKLDPASVKLTLNGTAVLPTLTKTNDETTVLYVPPSLLPPNSTNTVVLTYADNAQPPTVTSKTYTFAVPTYKNVTLPTPIFIETFESTALGGIPAGWTVTNNTDNATGTSDLGDPKSDAYLNWVVIDRDQVYINGTNDFHVWEADDPDGRVSHIAPGQLENGKVLAAADLMAGKFMYAESDERSGRQVQVVFTKDYDLTGKSDIYVSYHSSYNQNQDSMAVAEYSIDQGKTWLPIRYFMYGLSAVTSQDGSRIAYTTNAQGVVSVDAVATLTKYVRNGQVDDTTDPRQTNDTPQYDDGTYSVYGDYVEARPLDSLGPFIEGRINDDSIESHRVEIYRLSAADNQKTVRLRFVQVGTGSWYWGLDNIGFYSIPSSSSGSGNPAELGQSVNGFQDDFKGATRDPNWVAVGPGGDHYVQTNGVLQVSAAQGDPNHLIYMGVGASNNVQEVLARMRVVGFGANNDGPRGGVAVGVNTNVTGHIGAWIGANINFRDFTGDVAGGTTRHFRMLDDNRAWGPQLNTVWTNNVWYWTRLRVEPKADGTNDYFGKVWLADGSTPEPSDWQLKWPDAGTGAAPTPLHAGWAGITGCSSAALGQTEVDYVLIKSATLPSITVNFDAQGPAVNPPVIHSIVHSGNNAVVDWFGGTLQSGLAVTGPWLNVANTPSPTTNSVATATAAKFFRVAQ